MKTQVPRSGFSLIELFIVIAILGVLTALAVGITTSVITSQRNSNTEATMQTVKKVLDQHWAQVVAESRKETPSQPVASLAGDVSRARVIWTKLRLVEAFPEKYSEVLSTSLNPMIPAWHAYIPKDKRKYPGYTRTLQSANLGSSLDVQSGTCLLMALSIRRGGNTLKAEDVGALDTEDPPIGRDGLKEIVDGFGKPLAFERFAAGGSLQNLNPAKAGKGAAYADPLDPDGLLLNATWFNSPYTSLLASPSPMGWTHGKELEELLKPYQVYFSPPPSAVASYTMPVLISRGSTTDPGDDIYSYEIKQN